MLAPPAFARFVDFAHALLQHVCKIGFFRFLAHPKSFAFAAPIIRPVRAVLDKESGTKASAARERVERIEKFRREGGEKRRRKIMDRE
jgi:hypothetical protein